jgi:diacylglycerol kinase family enzyme
MIVILNPNAGGGTAQATWCRIEPRVREIVGEFELATVDRPEWVHRLVADRLEQGETDFVAAGGDGAVNLVATCLLESAPVEDLGRIRLGAIGLGSSNDFHKPQSDHGRIDQVPYRLDFDAASLVDVCHVDYTDQDGRRHHRPWLINASIGATAEANGFFNRPDPLLRFLKRHATGLAILYAAVVTLLRRPSRKLVFSLDGHASQQARVANLGVVKNPHFTGALRYDSPHCPDDGQFYVHMLANVTRPRLLLALARLSRGRFSGQRGARSWRATRLVVRAETPFALEGDGEVVFTSDASFSVIPRQLKVAA